MQLTLVLEYLMRNWNPQINITFKQLVSVLEYLMRNWNKEYREKNFNLTGSFRIPNEELKPAKDNIVNALNEVLEYLMRNWNEKSYWFKTSCILVLEYLMRNWNRRNFHLYSYRHIRFRIPNEELKPSLAFIVPAHSLQF